MPGAALAGLGTLIVVFVGAGLDFFGRAWGLHALIGGALLMIVGTQVLALGLCAHAYGTYFMGEQDPWFDRMRRVSAWSTVCCWAARSCSSGW